jgi:hypothetical protein
VKIFARLALFCLALLAPATAAEFAVYDIFLDPDGNSLAAYQIKIWDRNAAIKIISVEGGEHTAFKDAPFFDPKAIQRNIIKLASFRVGTTETLPKSKTRIASLHVEIGPGLKPDLAVRLEAAARPGGGKLHPAVSILKRDQP